MGQDDAQKDSLDVPVDLKDVCIIVGALALFAPILVSVETRGVVTIVAMTWTYYVPYGFSDLGYILTMGLFPFTVWRVVFVYQMVRYYRGRSARWVTFLLGVLAEIPLLIVYFIVPLLFPFLAVAFGSIAVVIPTPMMLVAASVFMWITPFPVPKAPFDDQAEPDRWWRKKADSPAGPPVESRRRDNRIHGKSRLKCPRYGSEEIVREMHPGSFGIRARFVYSCRKCGNQWEG